MIAHYLVGKFGQQVTYRIYVSFFMAVLFGPLVIAAFVPTEFHLTFMGIGVLILGYTSVGLVRKGIASRKAQKSYAAAEYAKWRELHPAA